MNGSVTGSKEHLYKTTKHYKHNRDVLQTLQPGDAVCFTRKVFGQSAYLHFSIYIGEPRAGKEDLVHVRIALDNGEKKSQVERMATAVGFKKARVQWGNFWKSTKGYKAFKGNVLDERPRDADKILETALGWVGKDWEYTLWNNNCEHFVNMCRYNKRVCTQTQGCNPFKLSLLSGRKQSSVDEVDFEEADSDNNNTGLAWLEIPEILDKIIMQILDYDDDDEIDGSLTGSDAETVLPPGVDSVIKIDGLNLIPVNQVQQEV